LLIGPFTDEPQGPSLLLLPPLFQQLYKDLGTTFESHVDLIQCNPNYVIHYHDGEKVLLSSDRAQLGREVDKWEGEGGSEGLEGFLRYVLTNRDNLLAEGVID